METPTLMKLANGLSVPSVQELAKLTLADNIPSRYICTDENQLSMGSSVKIDHETIPVIDLQKLLSPEPLVNHGVDRLLVDNLKSEIEGFFKLPMSEKMKYGHKDGDEQGYGQHHVESEDQKLDWADVFSMFTLPVHLRKRHLFPQLPLPFRDTLETYSSEMNKLFMDRFEMMDKALQVVEMKVIREFFEDGMQSMRMNYYPPCPRPDLVIGLTSHLDYGGLTILLQLNEVEGLQIRKEERWISVKPLPDAFIVNVGEVLEVMTNGIYRSVNHRGVVNSTKERVSIATFHTPKLESEIGPILSLITPETPALFKRGKFEDLLKDNLSKKLDGKTFLDNMRISDAYEQTITYLETKDPSFVI
ncbi:hypothetical protein MKX01_004482 [Papaver californicum]|nr:hypothetical protein MKX01_004482 [Papaver californicum]